MGYGGGDGDGVILGFDGSVGGCGDGGGGNSVGDDVLGAVMVVVVRSWGLW